MAARKITVTALGVSAKVDPDALDDQDLLDKLEDANVAAYELEALREAGAPNGEVAAAEQRAGSLGLVASSAVKKALFGSDWERIKRELRGEDGRLTGTRANEFVDAVSAQIGALIN